VEDGDQDKEAKVLINCGPANASKAKLRHCCALSTLSSPPPPTLRAPGPRCPSLVIMVIVIRTTVITVVMMTIADAMIIRNMIRGFSVLTILSHSAKTLVYDC